MFFKKNLKSESGMSMVEGALAVGLVGLGALAAASLSGNMSSMVQKSEGIVAASQFASSLGSYLYTAGGCTDLKGGGTFSEDPKEIVLSNWKYMGIDKFEGGYNPDGMKKTKTKYFDIEKLEANYESITGAPLVTTVDGQHAKTILKVRALLKVGKKPSEFYFNIPVLIHTTNKTVGYCSDEKTLAETCASLQGTYDPAAPFGEQCKLSEGCKIKGSYAVYKCSHSNPSQCDKTKFGSIANDTNQYTGAQSCPDGLQPTLTHSTAWSSRVKDGKKRTEMVSNTMEWFSCIKCPDTIIVPATSGGGGGGLTPTPGGGAGGFDGGSRLNIR